MMTTQLALTAEAISRGLLTVVPDLCVEVVSPSDRWSAVLERVGEYVTAGVGQVRVIVPEERSMHLFGPDRSPSILTGDNKIVGDALLPGFRCRNAEFFVNL